MDSSEERTQKMAALWADGLSAGAIAAECGVNKNVVAGVVARNRALSAPRPSPIKHGPAGAPKRSERPARAPLLTLGQAPLPAVTATHALRGRMSRQAAEKRQAVQVAAVTAPPPPPVRPNSGCCWPMWGNAERAGPNPRFCGVPSEGGKPYCPEHAARAYARSERA